jgi:hypothetical protein
MCVYGNSQDLRLVSLLGEVDIMKTCELQDEALLIVSLLVLLRKRNEQGIFFVIFSPSSFLVALELLPSIVLFEKEYGKDFMFAQVRNDSKKDVEINNPMYFGSIGKSNQKIYL